MKVDACEYLESSFMAPLLEDCEVTDISYNGEELFYVSNKSGRQRFEGSLKEEEVSSFLRQLANLTEKQFSVQCPVLDVSFGRYRINAVNSSLARKKNKKTYTFSVRIESGECCIKEDSSFFDEKSLRILKDLVVAQESIVIGGKTSSGKTELEKWLLLNMSPNTRVIVIDNVEELDMVENPIVDLSTWMVNEQIKDASFSGLIKNALRNNPDYIVVAEARGEEMLDGLISAMSGHPIITSIHAQDINAMPDRIARLAMLGNQRLGKEELLDDISHHLRYYVYVEKEINQDGTVNRFIREIGHLDEETGKMVLIYERKRQK